MTSRKNGSTYFIRDGDWLCPDTSCKNLNFSRREVCNRCKLPRPKDSELNDKEKSGSKSSRDSNKEEKERDEKDFNKEKNEKFGKDFNSRRDHYNREGGNNVNVNPGYNQKYGNNNKLSFTFPRDREENRGI